MELWYRLFHYLQSCGPQPILIHHNHLLGSWTSSDQSHLLWVHRQQLLYNGSLLICLHSIAKATYKYVMIGPLWLDAMGSSESLVSPSLVRVWCHSAVTVEPAVTEMIVSERCVSPVLHIRSSEVTSSIGCLRPKVRDFHRSLSEYFSLHCYCRGHEFPQGDLDRLHQHILSGK